MKLMTTEDFYKSFKGKSVAVLGNSKLLFSSNKGKEIDSHDIVCRMNAAFVSITKNRYAEHIGKKMDWLFVNIHRTSGVRTPRIARNYRLVQCSPFGYQDEKITQFCDYIMPKNELDFLLSKMKHEDDQSKKLTTGFRVLHLLSMTDAAAIDVYGFDWKMKAPSFLAGVRDCWNTVGHNFPAEKQYCMETYFNTKRMRHME